MHGGCSLDTTCRRLSHEGEPVLDVEVLHELLCNLRGLAQKQHDGTRDAHSPFNVAYRQR
ncbi:hypothetical protein BDI4_660032 [Burkholderia diffusa]|nr:hypothetical protein BDI4_660032 [Burkholderia diffusa]